LDFRLLQGALRRFAAERAWLADVLLYLVQIADHMKIDIDASVDRKLLKNRRKHPPLPPNNAIREGSTGQPKTRVLVVWENVQPKEGDVRNGYIASRDPTAH
jgi:hypothetical protein